MPSKELSFVIPTYRLRDVGETVEQYDEHFWRNGHSVRMIVFDDYRHLGLDFDPKTLSVLPDNLEAFDIADAALGHDFYGKLVETLRRLKS